MKSTKGVAVLLLGALTLTGCSARAGAAVTLTGCSARAEAAVTLTGMARLAAESQTAAPVMVAPASDDLRAALLGESDIPGGGFTPAAVATSHNGKASIGGGSFPGCPALEPMTTDETVSAAVTYAKGAMGAMGPYLTHAVVRFPART